MLGLKAEAKAIKSTKLWELLTKRLQFNAQVRSVKDSAEKEDLIFPKATLWTIEVLQQTIEIILGFEDQKAVIPKKSSIVTK